MPKERENRLQTPDESRQRSFIYGPKIVQQLQESWKNSNLWPLRIRNTKRYRIWYDFIIFGWPCVRCMLCNHTKMYKVIQNCCLIKLNEGEEKKRKKTVYKCPNGNAANAMILKCLEFGIRSQQCKEKKMGLISFSAKARVIECTGNGKLIVFSSFRFVTTNNKNQ